MTHDDVLFVPDAQTPSGRRARRGAVVGTLRGWRLVAFLLSAGAGLWYVLFLHGYLPGSSEVPLSALFGTGATRCLHDQGIASLWNWCMSLGLPVGAPRLTGLPQVYLGWLVSYIPGFDAWAAQQTTLGAFDVLAFLGAFRLGRRWGFPRWIALLSTVSFLTVPNVLVLNGFPYTFTGFLLLPAVVFAALRTLDWLDDGRLAAAVAASMGISLMMVFTDGYAFFSAALVISFLVLAWTLDGWSRRGPFRSLVGGAQWLSSLAGSALLYTFWVPKGAYGTHVGLEIFGLLGVDVVTLVVLSSYFLFPRLFGLHIPVLGTWGINDTPDELRY